MKLRLHRFIKRTRVEGPGLRACLWVQGCSLRCPGCANMHMWDSQGGFETSIEALVEDIPEPPHIEGVTFLGGEPFEQAGALAQLGAKLQRKGLSIVTFTGLQIEEIKQSDRHDWHSLLAVTDLLIDGPFIQGKFDLTRPWVGSSNQRFHFLTQRYSHLADKLHSIPNSVELRIDSDGSIAVNGMGDTRKLDSFLGQIRNSMPEKITI